MYDYLPLWKTLSEKKCSTYKLINEYGMSKGTLDSLKHNKNVTMNTLDWLCQILQVPIEKVVNVTLEEIADRGRTYQKQIEGLSENCTEVSSEQTQNPET